MLALYRTFDIGQVCVWCCRDTSVGSGRFVNRIPVHTDTESVDWLTEEQRFNFENVTGYGCEECYLDEEI